MKARLVVVGVAVLLAFVPLPAAFVERWYSRGIYASLQPVLTSASNHVPIALIDVAAFLLLGTGIAVLVRRVRTIGTKRALGRTAVSAMVAAAFTYLAFLILWGFNYRRVPLFDKVDYDVSRVNGDAAYALAAESVTAVNREYVAASGQRFDPDRLAAAFRTSEQMLAPSATVPGRAKRSVLGWYFSRAAIDGMTDPFFLEVILNPEVLEFERPFVTAHEWAHLAGYADESEANFVAWLSCLRGDALARYSAGLSAYELAYRVLDRDARRRLPPLDEGPRSDLRRSAERYHRSSPVVRTVARDVYDNYLKANRVRAGVASYDLALRLMIGTRFEPGMRPVLR